MLHISRQTVRFTEIACIGFVFSAFPLCGQQAGDQRISETPPPLDATAQEELDEMKKRIEELKAKLPPLKDADSRRSKEVVRAVISYKKNRDDESLQIIQTELNPASKSLHKGFIIGKLAKDKKTIPLLINVAVDDPSDSVRSDAVLALGGALDDPDAFKAVVKALMDKKQSKGTRRNAAIALSLSETSKAKDAVKEYVIGSETEPTEKHLDFLHNYLKKYRSSHYQYIREAASRRHPEAYEQLLELERRSVNPGASPQ